MRDLAIVGIAVLAASTLGCSTEDASGMTDTDDAGSSGAMTSMSSSNATASGGSSTTASTSTTSTTSSDSNTDPPPAVCEPVRLTRYAAQEFTGCGWSRTMPFMPGFVRQDGFTMAMAEPFYGSSYGGEPGEACGECWEVTTPHSTAIVMSDNLCPIQGNPLCSEAGQLHFDLSMEVAEFLMGGRNDMGIARPVPCPVEGNIHVQVRDRSWGYFQFVVQNHRIPVRQVEVRPEGSEEWLVAERVWGSVFALDNPTFIEGQGAGGVVRLTSSRGDVVESAFVLGSEALNDTADLGVQFDVAPVMTEPCQL